MTSILPSIIVHLPTGNSSDSHRILVIDDEPAILFAYRKLIEKDGMTVDICANLEDAVSHIKAHSYLAVISDMRLAGTDNGDGLEILRIIRKERPDTKTILSTGYGDCEIEKIARDLGVSYCFRKPVKPSEILGALRIFQANAVCPPGAAVV